MIEMPIFQVDAFTDTAFGGNPAAVVPLPAWLEDDLLLKIAQENNLSETAFFVRQKGGYALRWFTPTMEVDLCGHATLASAHVLFHHLDFKGAELVFHTASGPLTVTVHDGWYQMDFPSRPGEKINSKKEINSLSKALGAQIQELYKSRDYLAVLESPQAVTDLKPDFAALKKFETLGFIVTAPGSEAKTDFVSRFFAPGAGVDEDPVTGSAHSTLTPFWAERLGKESLVARQVSHRGGLLKCRMMGQRVLISGQAVTTLVGALMLPPTILERSV